jgi:hypothetical protein
MPTTTYTLCIIYVASRVESIATVGRLALETQQTEFGEIMNLAINLKN